MTFLLSIIGFICVLMILASGVLPLVLVLLFIFKRESADKYWLTILITAASLFVAGLIGMFVTVGMFISKNPDINSYIKEQVGDLSEKNWDKQNDEDNQEADSKSEIESEENLETEEENEEDDDSKVKEISLSDYNKNDNFMYYNGIDSYHGIATIKGYATVKSLPEAFCETNCTMFDHVEINIVENQNAGLSAFVSQGRIGFESEQTIAIGCLKNGTITRMNDSDDFGIKEYITNPQDTQKILNSSVANPVIIQLERFKYTTGRGAPNCYSHFANVTVR